MILPRRLLPHALTLLLALFAAQAAIAQHPADNLLHNPQFDGAQRNIYVWNQNPSVCEGKVAMLPGQGPDGQMALRLNPAETDTLKQGGIRLVKGEKYRMGGWIRTKDLKSDFWLCSFVVYNHWWLADASAPRFPENTNGKWIKVEKEFTAPDSQDGTYSFAIYVSQATGTIDFAAPFLIPLTEKAKAESQKAYTWEKDLKRITPYYPILSQVSCDTGELRFCTSFPPGQRLSDFLCRVSCNGKQPVEAPFDDLGLATITLGLLPEGDGSFTVEQLRKDDRSVTLANTYSFRAVKPVQRDGRRLNNLVVEILRTPLKPGSASFDAPEDGWYRIAFTQALPGVSARLDDIADPVVAFQENIPSETMRLLTRGSHILAIAADKDIAKSVELVVSKIPQLTYYPLFPAPESYFAKAASESVLVPGGAYQYDLDFCRRHLWPAFNSCIAQGAWNPKTPQEKLHRAAFDKRGIQVLGCNGFTPEVWRNGDAMTKAILNSPHVKYNDGRCLDEIFSDMIPENFLALIQTGWNLQHFDKLVYSWAGVGVSSCFRYPTLHRPAFAALNNISNGKGKILLEHYAYTTPDEPSMEKQLEQIACQLQCIAQIVPDAPTRVHSIMGGYLQPMGYCTDCYPQADPKVFYDRFFQTIATRPEYKDLAGLGCYCLVYCDEENARWIAAITRHYAVLGNTDRLSDKYGFTYNPGHLKNPDFEDGLDGWTARPAHKDTLVPLAVKGFGGKSAQNRLARKRTALGDACVQFTVSDKAPNTLTQTITGLVPGRLYSIRYATANPDDIATPTPDCHPIAIRATLDNATILPELGYDACSLKHDSQKAKRCEIILRKIVFRAQADSVVLAFTDWTETNVPAAPAGTRRIMNFVAVRPYFE